MMEAPKATPLIELYLRGYWLADALRIIAFEEQLGRRAKPEEIASLIAVADSSKRLQ